MQKAIILKTFIHNANYSNFFFIYINNIIGRFLKKGNREIALKQFFYCKYLLKLKSKRNVSLVLFMALINSLVRVYFIKKRFGGQKKELPCYLNDDRRVKYMIKSLLNYSYSKKKRLIDFNRLVDIIYYTAE